MSHEWLLEATLLLAGAFAGAAALRLLISGQRGLALRVGAACLILIALAIVLGRSTRIHPAIARRSGESAVWGRPLKARPLTLHTESGTATRETDPEAASSMSLLLGTVLLRVASSDRYVLSVEEEEFLTLDVDSTGLLFSCKVADSSDSLGGHIQRNVYRYYRYGMQPSIPDSSTFLVKDESEEVLRVRLVESRKIEVVGRFFLADSTAPVAISPAGGVTWKGGYIPPGSSIDLRPQGTGRINFESSGLVQIVPY